MKTTDQKIGANIINDGQHLLELAREWLKQGNTAVAFRLLNQAMRLKETEENKVLRGELSKEVGRVHMQNGQWDRAEDAYIQAKSLFLDSGNFRGAAESVRNLANLKFQLGHFSDSYSLCETAVEWATKSGDFQLRATILNTQGAIKSIEGKAKESIQVFRLCLSDFRRSGNKLRQAYVLHNIGLAQTELGQYTDAKASLEEALSLAYENNDLTLVELCFQNMAKLYLLKGELVTARSLVKSAREIAEMLKSPALDVDLDIVEATLSRRSGDFVATQRLLEKALRAAQEHNLAQHEAEILYESGLTAIEQGQGHIARTQLEAAVSLFQKTGGGGLKKAVEKLKALDNSANNR
jgi:tetratricopeptide (TPR) repeat protein